MGQTPGNGKVQTRNQFHRTVIKLINYSQYTLDPLAYVRMRAYLETSRNQMNQFSENPPETCPHVGEKHSVVDLFSSVTIPKKRVCGKKKRNPKNRWKTCSTLKRHKSPGESTGCDAHSRGEVTSLASSTQ